MHKAFRYLSEEKLLVLPKWSWTRQSGRDHNKCQSLRPFDLHQYRGDFPRDYELLGRNSEGKYFCAPGSWEFKRKQRDSCRPSHPRVPKLKWLLNLLIIQIIWSIDYFLWVQTPSFPNLSPLLTIFLGHYPFPIFLIVHPSPSKKWTILLVGFQTAPIALVIFPLPFIGVPVLKPILPESTLAIIFIFPFILLSISVGFHSPSFFHIFAV